MKRLPPYAKVLAEARARGLVPRRLGAGHVCVALHWNQTATSGLPRIVCPPGEDPRSYCWDFLAGLSVYVHHFQADAGRIAPLVAALLDAGVERVEVINRDIMERQDVPVAAWWVVFDREDLRHAA